MIKNCELTCISEANAKVINSKPAVTYIINPKSLELVLFNNRLKELLPNIKIKDKCYKALYNRDDKCEECPLLDLMNPFINIENEEVNQIVKKHIDNLNSWYNISYKKILLQDSEIYVLVNGIELEDKEYKDSLLREQREAKIVAQVLNNVLLKTINYKDAFEVNYQPIYDLEKNIFNKFEALIRMYDDDKNLILPNNFISVAESLGLMNQISYFVLEDICKTIKALTDMAVEFEAISMNISALQLVDKSFCKNVINIMSKYNVGFGFIEFEITEDRLLPVQAAIHENMNELMNKGIRFSIDDFGRGNSNMKYLLEFNIDVVKIDKYFISHAENNLKKKMFLNNLVNLFNSLEKEIIVEGVETKDQLEIIKKTNCKKVQGYYFSKPLSKNDLYKFLAESSK